jgi:hypothetical protein
MSNERAEACRSSAEDCRRQAARALNPSDRERWLRIAQEWIQLAEAAEAEAQVATRVRGGRGT